MKFTIGSLILECNSFSPLKKVLGYFRNNGFLLYGDEIIDYHQNVKNELAGFVDFVKDNNIALSPTCAAWAVPHPHTNMYEIGRKAAQLILNHHRRLENLRTVFLKIPLIAPLEKMTTVDDEPMALIIKEIEQLEKEKGILSVSFFGVHPWVDINDISMNVLYLDTPGLSSSNLKNLPFRKLKRKGLYPFNQNIDFIPKPAII